MIGWTIIIFILLAIAFPEFMGRIVYYGVPVLGLLFMLTVAS